MQISLKPTIQEIHNLYRSSQATPSEVSRYMLNRSKEIDKKVSSCLRFTDYRANLEAIRCDDLLSKAKDIEELFIEYPLFGIPYNLKDNILVEGEIATSASKIIEGFKAGYSATVYSKIHQAGGILISQSNLDEWAVGSSTENSAFGPSKNPFDSNRVPGGSSGGPAANIGSGQSVFALGSDTGGSIRQPASFCNVVGIKPTYGLVSRYGVMPLASSLDQVGPFTNTVEDNLTVLKVISGKDIKDQTSFTTDNQFLISDKKLRIGVPKEYFVDGAEQEIVNGVKKVIEQLRQEGHTIVDVSLPLTKYGLAVYYTTMTVETASNLQRYDGIRYGVQLKKSPDFEQFFSTRNSLFGDEPKRRIMLGTFASSAGYYDEYYNKAMMVKELMTQDFHNAFKICDVLIAPTTPEFPFKFGEKSNDIVKMYLSDILVYGANLCKIPALSVPMGFFAYQEQLLPAGVQIMANEWNESIIYQIGQSIQQKNTQPNL
jgi:aspartyl-tRNA(Asn)/glutamyl-tRNA(Gln) amidotransferase subunit A